MDLANLVSRLLFSPWTFEMDQLFSNVKSIMEETRDSLWRARCVISQEKAQMTTWDLPCICFRGSLQLEDGRTTEIRNAFAELFLPKQLCLACKKCGYVPATRVLLKSNKLVQQIYEGDLKGSHADARPYIQMLNETEKRNHRVVKELEDSVYALARKLKCNVARISKTHKELSDADVTLPNTRDWQDKLMNIKQHAGEWFQATNVGAPLNYNDAMIALERARLAKEKVKLEKSMRQRNLQEQIIKDGKRVMKAKGKEFNPKAKRKYPYGKK